MNISSNSKTWYMNRFAGPSYEISYACTPTTVYAVVHAVVLWKKKEEDDKKEEKAMK